jgi:hypothetical protein
VEHGKEEVRKCANVAARLATFVDKRSGEEVPWFMGSLHDFEIAHRGHEPKRDVD